jgi:hypothetical protein
MNTVRALLETGKFTAAPGVFNLVSAKIADRTDARVTLGDMSVGGDRA